MPEYPPDAGPSEIVAALHEQIAALSPEHAALVAAFERIPRTPRRPVRQPRPDASYRPRHKRMTVYAHLRLAGREPKAAARAAGISPSSVSQYEADFLATLGGGA